MVKREVEPNLVRRQLGGRLRYWRERARKTQEDVAEGLGCHPSKVYRIENGRSPIRSGDVLELQTILRIPRKAVPELVHLAKASSTPGWTDRFSDAVSRSLGIYAGLESQAASIRAFDPDVIPGILQTPSYIREVIGLDKTATKDVLDKRAAFRLHRQAKVLERDDRPEMRFVLGEAALRCVVGAPQLMRDQIDHLTELGETMDIRVRTYAAGLHPWMASGSFVMLAFADPADPSVVYTESHIEANYMETKDQLDEFGTIFDELYESTIPIKEFAL